MAKINEPEYIDFDLLIGEKAKLYLHKPEANCFQLGTVTFEVMEDEADGYRSMMEGVKIKDSNQTTGKNKFLADVTIGSDDEIYTIVDNDGHRWLIFGTARADSYYPKFIFDWQPKKPNYILDLISKIKK